MYTYHQYANVFRLPLLSIKHSAKYYYRFVKDYDCLCWHKLQDFKAIKVENNEGGLLPRFSRLFLYSSEDLFYFVESFTKDKTVEWHLFGSGKNISDCITEPKSYHFDVRYLDCFSADIGIVGVPL